MSAIQNIFLILLYEIWTFPLLRLVTKMQQVLFMPLKDSEIRGNPQTKVNLIYLLTDYLFIQLTEERETAGAFQAFIRRKASHTLDRWLIKKSDEKK